MVYHFAAMVGVEKCLFHPNHTLDTNLEGTINVIRAMENWSVKKIVFASSCEIYGNQGGELSEDNPPQPLSTYAVAKLASEEYIKCSDLDYTIVRLFNIYGKRQRDDFVISKFLKQKAERKPLTIIGDGRQTRCFTYIDDTVDGIVRAAGHQGTFNIGNTRAVSMTELADIIGGVKVFNYPNRKYTIVSRRANINKAWRTFEWSPIVGLEEGIRLINGA